jgi:hypothetical protein
MSTIGYARDVGDRPSLDHGDGQHRRKLYTTPGALPADLDACLRE